MNKENVFESKSINQLILIFAIPSILSLLLESLASMIDTAFAGHLGSISANTLTAMGILNPILTLLIAAQLIFGVSTSIVIAKGLGENNKSKVNDAFKVGFISTLIFSASISLFVFVFKDSLLDILGAKGQVREFANEYLQIALIFNVFSSAGYTLVNNIRAFGHPKMEIVVVVSATIINIVFNYIFTFVFDMGIKGIALATLISEIYYMSISAIFLIRKKLWITVDKTKAEEVKVILLALVKIGFVQFLMQSLVSVTGFIINNRLLTYGDYMYIGVWAIASNIHTIILLPLIGFTQGVQSIIAYYQGSQSDDKKKEARSKTVKYSLIYALGVTILISIFTKQVISIFTEDTEFIKTAIPIVKIIVFGFPFMGVMYTLITFMQVSNKERSATIVGIIRQVVVFLPLIAILPVLFSKYNIMGIKPEIGIFISMPLSDIIACIVGIYLIKRPK